LFLPSTRGHFHAASRALAGWDRVSTQAETVPILPHIAAVIARQLRLVTGDPGFAIVTMLSSDCY
jgi:hypothetical protein